MPFSAGKLAQCLIQGDSLRKQRRQGRESHNVSITLLGIIKGSRKITSERERKERGSRFSLHKKKKNKNSNNNNNNNNNKTVFQGENSTEQRSPREKQTARSVVRTPRLGLRESPNHKLALCFGVPRSAAPRPLPIAGHLPAQQSWKPCPSRRTTLPLRVGNTARDKVMGEQGVTATSAWAGFLRPNHQPAKGHVAFQQAPKGGKQAGKGPWCNRLLNCKHGFGSMSGRGSSAARNILKLTRGKGTFVLT